MAEPDAGAPRLLRVSDLSPEALRALLARAVELDALWRRRAMPRTLAGARIGLIVDEPGWRNPTALSLGAREMGATVETVPVALSQGEEPRDVGRYLANWFDAIAARTPDLARLEAFADAFAGPAMNLRTRGNHPFEILGDLAFLTSLGRDLSSLRVCVVAPPGNILASWAEAAAVLGLAVTQVFEPSLRAGLADGPLGFSADMEALREADAIVTDRWPRGENARRFEPWRVTGGLLDRCSPDVVFIPCPPVSRGEEVDESAMAHPRQMSWRAKAFLMHVQLAWLEAALRGRAASAPISTA